jgi:hypothetical protein
VIEEHPSELRADIARYFPGRSLNEFHRNETGDGTMSWLELGEFFAALPRDSMTVSAMSGDRARRRWTELEYMLATSLTLQHNNTLAMFLVNGVKQSELPPVFEWNAPDLRTPEQIEADEARETDLERRRAAFYDATRPGAADPEYAQKLAAARDEHLRLMAEQHPH